MVAACHNSLAQSAPEDGAERSSLTYTTASACGARWGEDVSARVAFDESRTSRVGVPLAGRVTALAVEPGQQVAAGAPLFVVASADLADLHNQRDRMHVELATARTNLARVQALVDAQSLPAKEIVVAEHDLAQARLAADTAEQKLAALRITPSGETVFTVTAPRAGIIVEHKVSVGQQVAPEAGSLLAIADLSHVWVYANLSDDAHLDIGAPARVTLETGGTVDGVVDQVSAIVDPERHTVPVRVALDNASGALRPGAYADVRFFHAATAGACVPPTAVFSNGADHYVYTRTAGKLHRRVVLAGRPDAGSIEIRAGLAPGEEVVATGGGVLDNQLSLED